MRQKSVGSEDAADKLVKNIRRKTARIVMFVIVVMTFKYETAN